MVEKNTCLPLGRPKVESRTGREIISHCLICFLTITSLVTGIIFFLGDGLGARSAPFCVVIVLNRWVRADLVRGYLHKDGGAEITVTVPPVGGAGGGAAGAQDTLVQAVQLGIQVQHSIREK